MVDAIVTGYLLIGTKTYSLPVTPTITINTDIPRVINVPRDYLTIQAAVNAAKNGDTIKVAAGTYNESVYITKGIVLIGAGSNSTTITTAGMNNKSTVKYNGIATDNASISNFTITGATSYGCGISCTNGSPCITNNIISGNNFGGIFCSSSSSPFIANNIISKNGKGISCSSSSPSITNNTISKNSSGISCESSSSSFTNISAGTHTVKLTLSGYKDWYSTATVTAGLTTNVTAALTPIGTCSATLAVFPEKVASGIYIYLITNNGEQKTTGKLGIIK